MLPVLSFAAPLPETLSPGPQCRDDYDWQARHLAVLARNEAVKPEVVFIGDSITHHWGGSPVGARVVAQQLWDELFAGMTATNLGFGFDYVENAYYRIQQGELAQIAPRLILINIGTNDLGHRGDSPTVCAAHVAALVALVREKQPSAKVLLLGIYPRREMWLKEKIAETNERLKAFTEGEGVHYIEPGSALAGPDGLADPRFFRDTVHPNVLGYEVLAKALRPFLQK